MKEKLVLIVEDNDFQRDLLNQLARKAGVNADLVKDGRDAINAVIHYPHYLAVFMDIGLINMDGLECTRRIRDLKLGTLNHVPIIAVTARSGEQARQECLEAGMDDFLTKPVTVVNIVSMLKKWKVVEPVS